MQKKNSIKETLKNLVDAISAPEKADVVPDGWFTTKEIAQCKNMSIANANKKIKKSLDDKSIESKIFKINMNGIVRPVPHYRIRKLN